METTSTIELKKMIVEITNDIGLLQLEDLLCIFRPTSEAAHLVDLGLKIKQELRRRYEF